MERAAYGIHARTLAQLGEQGAGSVAVSLARVGRISPHRIVNNLRGFFQVHVQSRLANVETTLQAVLARLANLGGLRSGGMVVFEFARVRRRVGGLGMYRNQFRFEFTKKLLVLDFQIRTSFFQAFASLCCVVLTGRRSLTAALWYLAGCNSHYRGDTLLALARRASIEVGWVVEVTLGAG
jgi:hypothetical protein